MTEQMRQKRSVKGLPVVMIISIILGAVLSNLVLSLAPLAGFAVIFGASVIIIAAVELRAYLRRKPRGPHFASVYREERKRKARGGSRPPEEHEELLDPAELIAPVEPY